MGTQTTTGRRAGERTVVVAATLLGAGMTLVGGVWALAAPVSFGEYTSFSPYNEHYLHDLGAFQLGIGVTLLLSLAWRDGPGLALAGFLVANSFHALTHWVDRDLGGRASDPWVFLAVSLVTGWALWLRCRQLGWVLGEVTTASATPLEPFVRQKTVLLTTYRRDGTPVATPVSVAVDGEVAYVRSWETTGKARRLRHTPEVRLAPCTMKGTPTGPGLAARAELLGDAEARHAAGLLGGKYPFLHGLAVPLSHRLLRYRTVHYRLTPAGQAPATPSAENAPTRKLV